MNTKLPNIAERALAPDWQAAQVYRWVTRQLTRQAAALRERALYADCFSVEITE